MKNINLRFKAFAFISVLLATVVVAFQNCSDQAQFESVYEETPIGSMIVDADQLEMTPSGCTDSVTPICDGGPDFVRKRWGTNGLVVGTTSDNGAINTNILRARDPNSEAAAYCANMIYKGFDDWYLPSRKELEAMFARRAEFGNVHRDFYWSSTEVSSQYAYLQTLVPFNSDGSAATSETIYKEPHMPVRCIRKIIK